MKLLKPGACHPASGRGNVKRMTVMGDAIVNWLSDRGSIPLSSTQKTLIFQGFLLLYKINLTRHMTDKEYTGQEIFT